MKNYLTPKWFSIIALLLALVGLYVDYFRETTVMIGSLMLAVWLAIALHELGHVIFGKWVGFEFGFFTVGPVQIEKTAGGIKVTENKNWTFFGGVALMMPPELKKDILIKKWSLFAAGGPITSATVGLTSFIVYELLSYEFLLFFAIMNAAIFVATIVPLKGSMKTDGYVILTLLKDSEEARSFIDELLIMKEILSKKPPAEWSKEYVETAKQKEANLANLQYAMMIYYYEIEKNGFPATVEALKEYSAIPVTNKNKFQLGFLIHMQQLELFLQDDVQVEQLKEMQQLLTSLEPVSFNRGKAMIAYLENDQEKASEYLHKVKKMISQNEDIYGFFKAEKTLTELVEREIVNY